MRGGDERSGSLFSYVDIEARVPRSHPLRVIRDLANEALETLAEELSTLYAGTGRPSILPESFCAPCCCKPSTQSARNAN